MFKKVNDPDKGRKSLTIRHRTMDKDSVTIVKKTFTYVVQEVKEMKQKIAAPQVNIIKVFDTKKNIEKFSFKVKGYFYLTHKNILFKICFKHDLKIQIEWKSKVFSPKKSVALT